MIGESPPAAVAPNRVLAMLLLVYIFNFVDRQVLAILAAPVQQDLGLTDTQMGLLGGFAFALLYSTLAVPLAFIADRTSRSWTIAIGLTLWSGFTAMCGFAQGFWHIFLARLGVGFGEAAGVAPSYALITDLFPRHRRAFALSVYSLGIPLGSALGTLAGAYIAATVDWRLAFITLGLAGLLLAPLFKLVVRDPPGPRAAAAPVRQVAAQLAGKPAFWLLAFGAAASSMLGYGFAFWMPSLLGRSFGLSLVETSHYIGAVMLIGGVAGILGGGWLGDRLGGVDRAWLGRLPALCFALTGPLFALGLFSSNAATGFFLFLVPQALAYVWLGPVISAVQHLVAPASRATASALFLLINNLVGIGGGIYVLGALSDSLSAQFGDEALRYSMLYALSLYGLAAILMALGGQWLRRDWVNDADRP